MSDVVYTIGHSTHSIERFLELLTENGIEEICDVRSSPFSKFTPQFNRELLKFELEAVGLGYVFMGSALGARSENPACYVAGKVQYDRLAQEPEYCEAIGQLEEKAATKRVALMCAEKDPITCHRMILVTRSMADTGLEFGHILEDGSVESNAAAEARLMEVLKIAPDLLRGEEECVVEAYRRQADRVAYVKGVAVSTEP